MNIELTKEVRAQAIASIERWFKENADEPIGNIQAAALLNFFVAEIAPSVYNQAIADAQQRLQMRVAELDIECHADEFGYWRRRSASADPLPRQWLPEQPIIGDGDLGRSPAARRPSTPAPATWLATASATC